MGFGAAGQFLTGLGALAGAFGNRGGGGMGKSDQYVLWKWKQQNALPLAVQAVKDAGFHPLAALGIPHQSQGIIPRIGKDRGKALEKSLKGMGQMVGAFDKEERHVRIDILKAQKRLLEQEYELKEQGKNSGSNVTPGGVIAGQVDSQTAPDWFTRNINYVNPEVVKKSSPDIEAGAHAADHWTNKRGVYVLTPTEKHAESVGEMVMPQIVDAVIDFVDRVKMGAGSLFLPGYVKAEIIRLRRDLQRNIPVKRGFEYQS